MLKVMTIIGTRPELIKMSRVIAEFDEHVNHILVHTGQNYDYELNQIFFEDLQIRKPDYFLNVAEGSVSKTIARVIENADDVMSTESPDAVLLYGDTNSCLAVIPAKRRKIPIFHMEAGNRCFDQRVPEELNRKIVDHLSDINLVLTEHARRNLITEGIRPEFIFKTGSHMPEVLDFYKDRINKSNILNELDIYPQNYFLVSIHREENVDKDSSLLKLIVALDEIAKIYCKTIIVSTHPRTRKKLEKVMPLNLNQKIVFLKPFGFFDYINLQINALCVLSDSGTVSEEASILNFPAVSPRDAHERPEAMDNGSFIISGLKKEFILNAIDIAIKHHNNNGIVVNKRVFSEIDDYSGGAISKKILRIVLGYTDHINRVIWKKD